MRIDSIQMREGSKIVNLTVDSGTSFPSSPNAGELFYRTDNENLYLHNGTTWVSVSGGGGGGGTYVITGDVTGTVDGGTDVLTLATVNSNVGSFGSASSVSTFTVNGKGLVTAAASTSIAIGASQVTSGTFADARIAESNVIQHQGALALGAAQITSGTFADARIAQSNVTQHQGALTVLESQITDGSLLARVGSNETITGTWTFSSPIVGSTSLNVLKAGDTMTGDLTIASSSPTLTVSATSASQLALFAASSNGSARWAFGKDNTAESGSNIGSNFVLRRYSDAGSLVDTPVLINRSSGVIFLNNNLQMGGTTQTILTNNLSTVSSASPLTITNDAATIWKQTTGGGNAEWMRLTATGLLGLGSNDPQSLFHMLGAAPTLRVESNTNTGAQLRVKNTVADYSVGLTSGNLTVVDNTNTATRLTVSTTAVTSTLPVVLPADPTTNLQAATKQYVDAQVVSASAGLSIVVVTGTTQTAVTGVQYVMTNTGATSTLTLPATPSVGNTVGIANFTGRLDLTVARSGSNIQGLAEDFTVNVDKANVQLRYVDATRGWILI